MGKYPGHHFEFSGSASRDALTKFVLVGDVFFFAEIKLTNMMQIFFDFIQVSLPTITHNKHASVQSADT